ncbi:MAG: hypothetical protein M1822_001030 [Bathelium mastoideum]|nr:MAG: hypothetical protein M1822_001030 [Bathelium mastoideum]
MDSESTLSRFLELPLEIRLEIYEYLLVPSPPSGFESLRYADGHNGSNPPTSQKQHSGGVKAITMQPAGNLVNRPSSYNCPIKSMPTLAIRILEPSKFNNKERNLSWQRTQFLSRAGPFLARTLTTTYFAPNANGPDAAILQANRQTYREAVSVLYSRHLFDFDTHVEAISPFINDLTMAAKQCIKNVAVTKRAAPFEKEFGRAEWRNACECIARMPALEVLKVQVIASKPSREGWHGIEAIEKEEMEEMLKEESFEWVRDLLKIKGLKVEIKAKVEKCMSPGSDALFEWVRFSRSIEGSFKDVVTKMMAWSGSVVPNNIVAGQQYE